MNRNNSISSAKVNRATSDKDIDTHNSNKHIENTSIDCSLHKKFWFYPFTASMVTRRE